MSQNEIPLEHTQLKLRLLNDYKGILPESTVGNADEQERNLLSRALAAYTIQHLSKCSTQEAADSVVDGGGDCGIDAIHYNTDSSTLYIIQSKYIFSGKGEPSLDDVSKFSAGIGFLLDGKFDRFNKNTLSKQKLAILSGYITNHSTRVIAVITYPTFNLISEDRLWLFEDLKKQLSNSNNDDFFTFYPCNLALLHDLNTGARNSKGVDKVELKLRNPGLIEKPYKTIYGIVPLEEIADLHQKHGNKLIVANIRCYQGNTDVNKQILSTITEEPEHFFYLNNGLTAYCKRFDVNTFDRRRNDEKNITAYELSIVNGAQTLGSVANFYKEDRNGHSKGYVFIKVISLERCSDDRQFAERITRSTNFQNQVTIRDFVSLDEKQKNIADTLRLSEIGYHYKTGFNTPKPDASNFTLDEATTACACLHQTNDCDFVCRLHRDKDSLWSFENIYNDELSPSRYSRVFKSEYSARLIWRAVQTQRIVLNKMNEIERDGDKQRYRIFGNLRWMVLNIVFLKLRTQHGEHLAITEQEKNEIEKDTAEIAELLWTAYVDNGYTNDYPWDIFSDKDRCSRLRAAVLRTYEFNAKAH